MSKTINKKQLEIDFYKFIKYFFFFLPICEPWFFTNYYHLSIIFRIIQVCDCLWLLYDLVNNKCRISKFTKIFILFFIELILVTIANNGSVRSIVTDAFKVIFVLIVFDNYKDDFINIISSTLFIFELLIYINLLTFVLCPNGIFTLKTNDWYGLSSYWLLGVPNTFLYWLYPALMVAWVYRYLKNKKIRTLLLTLCILITEIIGGSGTGRVGIFILAFILFIPFIKNHFNPRIALLVVFVAFVLIVIIRRFDLIAPIIVNVLGKDLTFTNRVFIWSNALKMIKKNPIFGYGVQDYETVVNMLGYFTGRMDQFSIVHGGASHCHDEYLQILFEGGVVSGIIFVRLIYEIFKYSRSYKRCPAKQTALYSVIVLFIIGITEVFNVPILYFVLIVAYHTLRNFEKVPHKQ